MYTQYIFAPLAYWYPLGCVSMPQGAIIFICNLIRNQILAELTSCSVQKWSMLSIIQCKLESAMPRMWGSWEVKLLRHWSLLSGDSNRTQRNGMELQQRPAHACVLFSPLSLEAEIDICFRVFLCVWFISVSIFKLHNGHFGCPTWELQRR